MEKALLVLIMAFGLANAGMDMNKWVEHNKQIHFLHSCWGHKTMMNYRMTVEELKKECNQLQPAFDMSIFDMESDEDDDYFGIPTNTVQVQYPARFAYPSYPTSAYPSMPAHMPFQPTQGASSPLNAWMSFYSPYYNPSLVKRTKRAMKKPTAAEMRKFTEDMAMFKQQKMGMMGNLTCVLAKFGSLDSNLDINLSSYTEDMWKYFAEGEKPEPEFKERLVDGYKTCYELSRKIPQSFLDMKGPVYKRFGRQKMFFKCVDKMETMMCVKKDMANWIEMLYGKEAFAQREKYGLPADKYEAAMMKFEIMDSTRSPSEKFVDNFMYGM